MISGDLDRGHARPEQDHDGPGDAGHQESRTDGARHRSPLTWLVAAGAGVIIGTGITLAVHDRDADEPLAPSGEVPGAESPSVTRLRMPADQDDGVQECAPPTPLSVGGSDVAFDGVVTSMSGGVVTLVPTRWYAGARTEQVTVRATERPPGQLLSAVRFREGRRYLVAAVDGDVSVCGVSRAWTPSGQRLYQRAFTN